MFICYRHPYDIRMREYCPTMTFPSRGAAIVGVYMTKQARSLDKTPIELELEALKGCLADAGLSLADVDGVASMDAHSPVGGADDPHYYWAEQLGQRPLGLMEIGLTSGALAKMAGQEDHGPFGIRSF